jgi:FkbM family methyltransferase
MAETVRAMGKRKQRMALRKRLKGFVETIGKKAAHALQLLPLRLQAAIKQNFNPLGTLDYDKAEIRMCVNSQEQVSRLHSCAKEPETVRWIEEFSLPGDVFYDIGANVGAYSLVAMAATKGRGQVIALEPSFLNYMQLNANVLLNGIAGQVLPICVALSDCNSVARFDFSELVPGAANHTLRGRDESPEGGTGPKWGRVITYRMDDLVHVLDLPVPNLMKIDVDGGEFQVLKGAERTLEQEQLRSILMEVYLSPGTESNPAIDYLVKTKGFRIAARYQRQINDVFNYIFIRQNLSYCPRPL